jgi:hypothetical protein
MSEFLQEMIDAVARIKRDYPDVPVRFEFAPDVWAKLVDEVSLRNDFVSNVLTSAVYPPGVPCMVSHHDWPGEWGPVFRTRV